MLMVRLVLCLFADGFLETIRALSLLADGYAINIRRVINWHGMADDR